MTPIIRDHILFISTKDYCSRQTRLIQVTRGSILGDWKIENSHNGQRDQQGSETERKGYLRVPSTAQRTAEFGEQSQHTGNGPQGT